MMTDTLIEMMVHHGIPITRKAYLDLAYWGEAPDPLPAELEAELPPELQHQEDAM